MSKRIKKIIFIGIALVLAASIYFGVGIFKDLQQLAYTIFPGMKTVFSSDMKLIHVNIHGTEYEVPKAYIRWKSHLKGGNLDSLLIWASLKDDMQPWPVSEAFKKKDKDSLVLIEITKGSWEQYRRDFPYNEIISLKRLYEEVYKNKYKDFEQGIYKDIFKKYNGERASGEIVQFYLIPKIKTEEGYLIRCPALGKLDHVLCTVMTYYTDRISYNFMIPFGHVEDYLDYDRKVKILIDRLIIKQ